MEKCEQCFAVGAAFGVAAGHLPANDPGGLVAGAAGSAFLMLGLIHLLYLLLRKL